jgi:hypothetical protein
VGLLRAGGDQAAGEPPAHSRVLIDPSVFVYACLSGGMSIEEMLMQWRELERGRSTNRSDLPRL